jgi:two-component system sensor histidine kinase ArlS
VNNSNEPKKTVNTTGKTNKSSFSLVMKLHLHTVFYTIGVLLIVNIALFLSIIFFTVWKAEDNAAIIFKELSPQNQTVLDYYFEPSIQNQNGILLLNSIHKYTPMSEYNVKRWLWFDSESGHPISAIKYRLILVDEGITITCHIGSVLTDYRNPFLILLALEGLLIIWVMRRNRRKIRQILRPLTEMSKQAQNLSSSAGHELSQEEMKRLRDLAGTISNIDVTKLDKRLSVDGPQSELKNLADAINNMLNRIDEAYRAQVRFVSDASHELRTPISVIQGYINLLDRWGKNDEKTLQESIDAIKSEAENMKELIEQLLFLARGDNETLRLELEIFDCSDIIREIIKETQMIDTFHTFRIKSDITAFVNADRQLLKQAVRILVDNSIKYTPDNGEILVSVLEDNGIVRISVQDNGMGIDPETLPYIFDRFYRSDESRARRTGGSGLGLSIAKWIIDRHGGSIEVISRKEIGTRTTILLPRVDSPRDSINSENCE